MALLADIVSECGHGLWNWSAGGWIWMGLMMLAGLILIVVVVYLLLKGTSSSQAQGAYTAARHKETPLEIARRRYAAGEITHEEFEMIRKDLSG